MGSFPTLRFGYNPPRSPLSVFPSPCLDSDGRDNTRAFTGSCLSSFLLSLESGRLSYSKPSLDISGEWGPCYTILLPCACPLYSSAAVICWILGRLTLSQRDVLHRNRLSAHAQRLVPRILRCRFPPLCRSNVLKARNRRWQLARRRPRLPLHPRTILVHQIVSGPIRLTRASEAEMPTVARRSVKRQRTPATNAR